MSCCEGSAEVYGHVHSCEWTTAVTLARTLTLTVTLSAAVGSGKSLLSEQLLRFKPPTVVVTLWALRDWRRQPRTSTCLAARASRGDGVSLERGADRRSRSGTDYDLSDETHSDTDKGTAEAFGAIDTARLAPALLRGQGARRHTEAQGWRAFKDWGRIPLVGGPLAARRLNVDALSGKPLTICALLAHLPSTSARAAASMLPRCHPERTLARTTRQQHMSTCIDDSQRH